MLDNSEKTDFEKSMTAKAQEYGGVVDDVDGNAGGDRQKSYTDRVRDRKAESRAKSSSKKKGIYYTI